MSATVITGATVFDGVDNLGIRDVVIDDGVIVSVGGEGPADAERVRAAGGTLLPGFIDAHTHTSHAALGVALRFGVTTELEMQGTFARGHRDEIEHDDSVADVRSSGFGLTPPGGHPSELFPEGFRPGPPPGATPTGPPPVMPRVTTPAQAVEAVQRLVDAGSDYIKFMVDDGSVEGHPGLPTLDQATLNAGVAEAQRLGMLTIAHALSVSDTRKAVRAGVQGLAHLFMDEPHTDELVALIAGSGAFVVACVVLDASMIGITGAELADDPRAASRLDAGWMTTLRSSFGHFPNGRIETVLASAKALHDAGVDLLVGTDASVALPFLGGVAHGASVHHELQYLVRAGLAPIEALRAATSVTARRFRLDDRGRIAPGLRADLLLVDGHPFTDVTRTLDLRGVWRRGVRLAG
jgi:imidazolonepropionase-like amidohydrolase